MSKHEVNMKLHTKIVSNKDVKFDIKSDSAKLGTLLISKGNIEWIPAGNHVNKRRLSWEKFSEIIEAEGRNVKI